MEIIYGDEELETMFF